MRDGTATMFFHPGEGEIDAGRDAGRGADVLVFDPEWLRFDSDSRIALSKLTAKAPMRSGTLAFTYGRGCRGIVAFCPAITANL